jgi:hypothetical protein
MAISFRARIAKPSIDCRASTAMLPYLPLLQTETLNDLGNNEGHRLILKTDGLLYFTIVSVPHPIRTQINKLDIADELNRI